MSHAYRPGPVLIGSSLVALLAAIAYGSNPSAPSSPSASTPVTSPAPNTVTSGAAMIGARPSRRKAGAPGGSPAPPAGREMTPAPTDVASSHG